MFEDAGFYGVEILSRAEALWQVIDGVEFRSLTVRAYKGKEGACSKCMARKFNPAVHFPPSSSRRT